MKLRSARKSIISLGEAVRIAARARRGGKIIVTTNGCFDILHVGHVRNLERAKALGDILIVGVNTDRSVRKNKGPARPIVPERERAELVAALRAVDYVFLFSEPVPNGWLAQVRPHIHVKGSDRAMNQIVERGVVRAYGGKIVLLPVIRGRSSTAIIEKIGRTYGRGRKPEAR